MSREHYEQPDDRKREMWVAERFAREMGLKQIEMPENSRIDRFLIDKDDNPRGWVEIKCRTTECGHYDTYALSEQKFKTLLWLHKITNVPSLLVVGFMDMIAWVEVNKLGGLRVVDGGRQDRNDPLDIERLVHIPITKFRYIEMEEEV